MDLGEIKFTSCTYRLFKNAPMDESTIAGDKYGAWVIYQKPINHYENEFQFDRSITLQVNLRILYIYVFNNNYSFIA